MIRRQFLPGLAAVAALAFTRTLDARRSQRQALPPSTATDDYSPDGQVAVRTLIGWEPIPDSGNPPRLKYLYA